MREQKVEIDSFARRHIGPSEEEVRAMLRELGFESLDALIDATVPRNIRREKRLNLPEPKSETEALAELREIAKRNKLARSFIGAGYYDCITPPVIQRNILENPGWYTAYTPYQAEIAQGRLEALLNFQQMIIDLTALDIANASMLDEATAAAEAMALCHAAIPNRKTFFVADNCHPQTIAVVQTRARPLGIDIKIGDYSQFKFDGSIFGALVQYPATDGAIEDYADFVREAHNAGALVVVAADILALTLAETARRIRRGRCRRQYTTFRSAVGIWRTARGIFRHARRITSVTCLADWWAFHMMSRAAPRIASRCRLASNTSAATKRPATFARPKCSSPLLHRCMRFITVQTDYVQSHNVFIGWPVDLQMVCVALGCTISHENFFDTVRVEVDSSEVICGARSASGLQSARAGPPCSRHFIRRNDNAPRHRIADVHLPRHKCARF